MGIRDYQNQANTTTGGRFGEILDQVGDVLGDAAGSLPAPNVHVNQAAVTIDPKSIAIAIGVVILLVKVMR